jgi:thiol-disulfide isomerase/thioredoxin
MAQQSVPYESALTNGKPTLVEFYADWCSSCQSLAPSIAKFHEQYGSQVNFVMLNVDDSQWRPLMQQYQVMGVPQFFFITSSRRVVKTLVGRVPESILAQLFEQLLNPT